MSPTILWQGRMGRLRGDGGLREHRFVYNSRDHSYSAETAWPDAMGEPQWQIARDGDEVMILDAVFRRMTGLLETAEALEAVE